MGAIRGQGDEKMEGRRGGFFFFSEAAGEDGRCRKQKRASRLKKKKPCMNASERPVLCCLACLIPVTPSQAVPVRGLLALSLFLLSALFLMDKTFDC